MHLVWTMFYRSFVMFVSVLLAFRLLGKRTMAELTPMDKVAGITYGTVAGSVALTRTIPLDAGVLVVASFALLAWLLGQFSVRMPSSRPWLLGHPRVVMRDGQVLQAQLSKVGMTQEDLDMRLRELKVQRYKDVKIAQMEIDGKLGLVESTASSAAREPRPQAAHHSQGESRHPSHHSTVPDETNTSRGESGSDSRGPHKD